MKAPIKEPLNVDLEVVSRELTAKEAESLQEFLQANSPRSTRSNARPSRRASRHSKEKVGK